MSLKATIDSNRWWSDLRDTPDLRGLGTGKRAITDHRLRRQGARS
jgi:hypothetical protein